MKEGLTCPDCGTIVARYRNPFPTVDIIIRDDDGRIARAQAVN